MSNGDRTAAKLPDVEIVPASPDVWPALAELFAAGGDPKWCWCQYWRKPGANWSNTTPAANRADLEALVRAGDPAPGLVALRDGAAVGWVGLGPREAFPRLGQSRVLPQLPGEGVWSINCFVVARTARRSGVAKALLAAAVEYAAAHGAVLVEGYPVATAGSRIPSASVYTGTASMFEAAAFDVVAESTSKAATGAPRVVMRREV
jgi:GNAT superfamily N-acetyltransferase